MNPSLLPFSSSRSTLSWVAAAVLAMLAFGLYLQYMDHLTPCPMCIVQRYAYILIFAFAAVGAVAGRRAAQLLAWALIGLTAAGGAFVAARQSWLQWNPPPFYSCGRDFYGMVEQLPLSQALPKILAGSGDCTAVDWTFLGGTIANWSFCVFVALMAVAIWGLQRLLRRPARPARAMA